MVSLYVLDTMSPGSQGASIDYLSFRFMNGCMKHWKCEIASTWAWRMQALLLITNTCSCMQVMDSCNSGECNENLLEMIQMPQILQYFIILKKSLSMLRMSSKKNRQTVVSVLGSDNCFLDKTTSSAEVLSKSSHFSIDLQSSTKSATIFLPGRASSQKPWATEQRRRNSTFCLSGSTADSAADILYSLCEKHLTFSKSSLSSFLHKNLRTCFMEIAGDVIVFKFMTWKMP